MSVGQTVVRMIIGAVGFSTTGFVHDLCDHEPIELSTRRDRGSLARHRAVAAQLGPI